jgi:hypothetical protein
MKKIFNLLLLIVLIITLLSMIYSTINLQPGGGVRRVITWVSWNSNVNTAYAQAVNPLVKNATSPVSHFDYLKKYPFYLNCKHNYSMWQMHVGNESSDQAGEYNYSAIANTSMHEIRITRAVLVYFPMDKSNDYMYEFKWLYRSWINMMAYEPAKWRTDLVVFVDKSMYPNASDFFLTGLNCSFNNQRQSPRDRPMCTLRDHKALRLRNFTNKPVSLLDSDYDSLLKLDIFGGSNVNAIERFYQFIATSLNSYGYLDSILMAFEGYDFFKSAGYDFLIRSDMDVFLTPLFAQWLPRHCNDFYVGRGGYSTSFNTKRFQRIAKNLNLNYGHMHNLGSTWYSTPEQFRLVSYLTLFGMVVLSLK